MMLSCFTVRESQTGDLLCLHLTGELDLASVPMLEDRLSSLHLHGSGRTVRLDLSDLEFMDSTGLHALIRAMNDASANGWRLQINRDMSPQVERVLKLVHFERLIPGYDSDER
jgi:anti-sigma B factor antagonist